MHTFSNLFRHEAEEIITLVTVYFVGCVWGRGGSNLVTLPALLNLPMLKIKSPRSYPMLKYRVPRLT